MMSKEDLDREYPDQNDVPEYRAKTDPEKLRKKFPSNRIPKQKKRKRKNK